MDRLKAKASSCAAYAMIGGLSAVGIYFGTSCWPHAAYNPEIAKPIRPERWTAEQLGPTVEGAVKALSKRGPEWGKPSDAIE